MDGDDPMSLTGIGRVLGISRDRVRNLECKNNNLSN